MVLRLADVLGVAPREQNLMLGAAGFAPAFAETPLDVLGQVSDVLDQVLTANEPHVAVVVNRRWDVLRSNLAAQRFVAMVFGDVPSWVSPPMNMMRMVLHPDGLRPHVVDWEPTAASLLRRLHRDCATHPHDPQLQSLLEEVLTYPDVAALGHTAPAASASDLMLRTTYRIGGEEVSLFTTVMTIGDSHDLTLNELRLETFWPADADSAQRWQRWQRGVVANGAAG